MHVLHVSEVTWGGVVSLLRAFVTEQTDRGHDVAVLAPGAVVKRGANWARRHRSAVLIGRVKRSPRLQRASYVPLRDKPALPPEDAAYIRAQLGPEVACLEGLVGFDLRSRWGWPA